MSLLTPVKMPVKVYRWDDAGAPALDKTSGCMMTIFKACLVNGYGTKEGAGWTMPFEDTAAGVKVFRPPLSPETDFYLRVSADTGKQMTAQVYLNMTDANTGDLKLQCATPFKYSVATTTGKWVLVATDRGLCFFDEMKKQSGTHTNQTGGYFFCGDTAKNSVGDRGVYLRHSGGAWGEFMLGIIDNSGGNEATDGRLLDVKNNSVVNANPVAAFDGKSTKSTNLIASQLYLMAQAEVWLLPFFAPSVFNKNNYDVIDAGDMVFLNHSTSQSNNSNMYVRADFWEY